MDDSHRDGDDAHPPVRLICIMRGIQACRHASGQSKSMRLVCRNRSRQYRRYNCVRGRCRHRGVSTIPSNEASNTRKALDCGFSDGIAAIGAHAICRHKQQAIEQLKLCLCGRSVNRSLAARQRSGEGTNNAVRGKFPPAPDYSATAAGHADSPRWL